ncbi:type II toxin-antitoxin system VapC family toxin [Candidatus Gottesmanbacteria bacterium]|nr:type II toxin-antitoxin system VapC family toxin [Candidatus Gottesmanbacteria bacterium]
MHSKPKDNRSPKCTRRIQEVAIVGSQRYNREATIAFIEGLFHEGTTTVVLETAPVVARAWEIFKQVTKKDFSWVDCYSLAIIEAYKIETVLTFDKELQKMVGFPRRQTPW